MSSHSTAKTPKGWLRGISDWLRGTPSPASPPDAGGASAAVPPQIAHYAITGKLGQGGMGVVYAARDERLGRMVALKTMLGIGDESARQRFWREARAAASVNHPNVCQIYEVGEAAGEPFIAMELLEGEPLAERLRRGALSVADALPIANGILAALQALHARGVVHRDLKPSNVFLTPHGVKLLDFGLARPSDAETARTLASADALTQTGMVIGTPRYMAPEQVRGEPIDARTDLFAAGVIVFEMLAGRPPFAGRSVVEILHATLHEQPPALTGSPAVAAVDRVLRKALAKRPDERPASAEAMAAELRAANEAHRDETPVVARALTRLVVLPFRVLRPDPDTGFLAFSLPDAIATSLSGIGSLVVRSSATAARFAGDTPDLKTLAQEADVDRVVMGTVLRSGDQLQVTAQLVETPSGTLVASHAVLAPLGDLFQLQSDIVRRVVDALSLPLGAPLATPNAPRNAESYALYLRANEMARRYETMVAARDLYRRSVELDPGFAPAWAQLGRCERVIGKYIERESEGTVRAEQALRKALELDPKLTVAHKFFANLEADSGQSIRAMERLLGEAARHGNDPELFAGLVHACRYCGLFDLSIAAHDEARRLDPNVPTSVLQTRLMALDLDGMVATRIGGPKNGDEVIFTVAKGMAGRRAEAREELLAVRDAIGVPAFRPWADFLVSWLDKRPADMLLNREAIGALAIMEDPEAIFQEAWMLADAGERTRSLALVQSAVARGYYVASTLEQSRSFDQLRTDPLFQQVVAAARAGQERARATFLAAGGERLLGQAVLAA